MSPGFGRGLRRRRRGDKVLVMVEADREPDIGAVLLETDELRLSRPETGLYLARIGGHLTHAVIARLLDEIWGDPSWCQPWAFVIDIQPDTTYDLDVRHYAVPPKNQRAVTIAIVTPRAMHRMVVSTIGVGMRLGYRLDMSAFETLAEAMRHVHGVLERAQSPFR